MYCEIPEIKRIQKNYELICYPDINHYTSYRYDKIILLPYYTPLENPEPFEVIIKNSLKELNYSYYEENLSINENESKSDDTPQKDDDDDDKSRIDDNGRETKNNGDCKYIKISKSLIIAIIYIIIS